ncbi:MAG: SgcJ/EcaC family oxidoreductase [Planctomycetota bacterium]|jgi:uncharacterized protein (TIGR02246 family)
MRKRTVSLAAALTVLSGAIAASAASPNGADEEAIRKAFSEIVEAFDRHDAEAIGAMWTEDGDYVDENGQVYSGREAIVEEFRRYFAENKGRSLRLHVESIRFVSRDVAIIDGTSEVDPPPEGPPVCGRYTAVRVKRGGKWLVAAIRETAVEVPSNYEHLQELEWMVGEWLDEDESASVRTSVRWGENKNFLIHRFAVQVAGRSVLSGTQRIGWDPERKQIKSWVFDSEGTVSEGLWIRDGDRWVVRSTGTLRDGSEGSATQVLTMIDDDTFSWQSRNRTAAGETLPDGEQFKVVRLPPRPE